ncbi:amidohydrolase family protein [Aureisphaera galaxeae]|uniref:amidohydrolase family protein n=1 Tax=Aureisphaera galaxeae TaxID=1538023 RepID=UPI002350F02A|nr:amidohydrolase family protein [Aureisphaera galaxeae]MDC8003466.1 amidohydrolase family protein [Aureisphaera galaxeae]
MKTLKNILLATIISVGLQAWAQQTPAPAQSETITITGATAHLGNGSVIENSVIVFSDGKITAIGDASTPTQGNVVNANGKHIYPGFIAPVSTLGLGEVDALRQTRDFDEIGEFIPNIRSIIAYNSESKVVESLRPNGVLLAQVTPQGGRISGTSSIVQLDAWNWEDAAIKTDDGIHLRWPNSFKRGRWWLGEDPAWKPDEKYNERIEEVRSYLNEAKAYGKASASSKNEGFAAMQGLYNGSKKLYLYAQGEREIVDAITTAKEAGINQVVLVGGYEAYKVIPFLKKHNIPVLVNRVHTTPMGDDDDYDLPYKLPKLLAEGGLLVGLNAKGQMERMNTRNLPFYAGHLVGQGVDKETALQMITLNTAKILGIDSNYGSLEVGKSATFFVSEGDALDMRGNMLTHAFIDGRKISLETHQTKLWKRYMDKYSGN